MYIVIRKDKAEKLEEKLHHVKKFIEEIAECFEEAAEERYDKEDYFRDRARGGRNMARDDEDWYDDDRFMARGRGGRSGRGRY